MADGAENLGTFTPQIGMSVNRILVINKAASDAPLDETAARMGRLEGVVGAEAERLEAVREPRLGLMADASTEAIFTNRWFHVHDRHVAAFEEDTVRAWVQWEPDTRSEVAGLWRRASRDGVTSYLLVVRYRDLAAWMNSRFWVKRDGGAQPEWVTLFARRRGYMADTWVMTARCLGAVPKA